MVFLFSYAYFHFFLLFVSHVGNVVCSGEDKGCWLFDRDTILRGAETTFYPGDEEKHHSVRLKEKPQEGRPCASYSKMGYP